MVVSVVKPVETEPPLVSVTLLSVSGMKLSLSISSVTMLLSSFERMTESIYSPLTSVAAVSGCPNTLMVAFSIG